VLTILFSEDWLLQNINQQAKTFFATMLGIVVAGMSVAFATFAFTKPSQPKPSELDRSEITPPYLRQINEDTKTCEDAVIEQYISKFGTSKLTDADFEGLVKCRTQSIPSLSQALNNDRIEVRAGAAFALSQIGQESYVAVPRLTAMLLDDSSTDVRAIAAYTLGRISPLYVYFCSIKAFDFFWLPILHFCSVSNAGSCCWWQWRLAGI
jgi:HEAT repeats